VILSKRQKQAAFAAVQSSRIFGRISWQNGTVKKIPAGLSLQYKREEMTMDDLVTIFREGAF
jgi:hypothetical protein